MMTIWVNQEAKSITENTRLLTLLEQLDRAKQTGIAVALNQQVIPRQQWAETTLKTEDKVTIITATQGG